MHSILSISARLASVTRPTHSSGDVGHVGGDDVVGQHAGELVEPERRRGGEDAALVGDRLAEHHVEHAQPVGRDEQEEAVTGVVDVADLAAVDVLQLRHGMGSGW
jgi:hypothetical protein